MYEFLKQRKLLFNQYKDLSKKLPKNYMKIHFKSLNFKKRDIKTDLFPEELFGSNDTNQFMKELDSETKSYLLKTKNFQKHSKSCDKYNKTNINKKLDFLNKQTIILTKFNEDEDEDDDFNNNNKINEDENIYNKDYYKVCEKKRKKYINNLIDIINQNNNINVKSNDDSKNNIKKENNGSSKDIINKNKNKKDKNLTQSFFCEIVKIKNKKNLNLEKDEKNIKSKLKIKNENNGNIHNNGEFNTIEYNHTENNSKNCQTNFETLEKGQNQSKNIKNTLPSNPLILNNDDLSLKLKNNSEKKSINKKEQDTANYSNIKEIKYKNKEVNSYKDEDNNISKKNEGSKFLDSNIFESSQKVNLKTIIPEYKNKINKKEKKIIIPLFTNNTIVGTILNSSKNEMYRNKHNFSLENFRNSNNHRKRNRLNLFYMNTDSLKNKENYLLGNSNNFIGKTLKNYQTKNNIYLPNLSERMKRILPRPERQSNGFILA